MGKICLEVGPGGVAQHCICKDAESLTRPEHAPVVLESAPVWILSVGSVSPVECPEGREVE